MLLWLLRLITSILAAVVDAGNVVAVGKLPIHEQTEKKRVPVQSIA